MAHRTAPVRALPPSQEVPRVQLSHRLSITISLNPSQPRPYSAGRARCLLENLPSPLPFTLFSSAGWGQAPTLSHSRNCLLALPSTSRGLAHGGTNYPGSDAEGSEEHRQRRRVGCPALSRATAVPLCFVDTAGGLLQAARQGYWTGHPYCTQEAHGACSVWQAFLALWQ